MAVSLSKHRGTTTPLSFNAFIIPILFCLLIFPENLDILHQRRDGINGLAVPCQVVISDVNIEEVFPLVPYNGKTLYLREVNVIEREYRKDLAQASLLMGQ